MSAGYSGTPLARKLGIREGHRVWLAGPPTDLLQALAPLPSGAEVETAEDPDGRFDVVLLFSRDAQRLRERFGDAVSRLTWTGGLWACWPKKSSPLHRGLAREDVREVGLAAGLVDNKVCAVDDDWSGLRFVVRVGDRPESVDEGGPVPA